MGLLQIRTYPDPILRKVAAPVLKFGAELKKLTDDMLETMYEAPGIGLAAPQVGISQRLFVMDIDYERKLDEKSSIISITKKNPRVFINPQFLKREGEQIYDEGCLSVPGVYESVKRYEYCSLRYQDLDGKCHELEASGLFSVCLQHENDHLDGIVFIERLSLIKKNLFKNQFLKRNKKSSVPSI